MRSADLTNILGIVINLVSGDRTIDQEITEVRDFKAAASKLIARLDETAPRDDDPDPAPKAIKDLR